MGTTLRVLRCSRPTKRLKNPVCRWWTYRQKLIHITQHRRLKSPTISPEKGTPAALYESCPEPKIHRKRWFSWYKQLRYSHNKFLRALSDMLSLLIHCIHNIVPLHNFVYDIHSPEIILLQSPPVDFLSEQFDARQICAASRLSVSSSPLSVSWNLWCACQLSAAILVVRWRLASSWATGGFASRYWQSERGSDIPPSASVPPIL